MKKKLKRFRSLRGKIDGVALLLAFLNAAALEVDFSDCIRSIDEIELSYRLEASDDKNDKKI